MDIHVMTVLAVAIIFVAFFIYLQIWFHFDEKEQAKLDKELYGD